MLQPLDQTGNIPLYVRLATTLWSRVTSGEWRPGQKIPTIDALSEEYGVARVTVSSAFRVLVENGMFTASRGRGTFVVDPLPSGLRLNVHSSINDRFELPEEDTIEIIERSKVDTVLPDLLPVDKRADSYVRIVKTQSHKGVPFSVIDLIVAESEYARFPDGADERFKILKLMIRYGKRKIKHGRKEITLTYADNRLAKLLRCPVAAAVIKVRTWRFDSEDELIFGSVTLYHGDNFSYDVIETDFNLDSESILPTFRQS